MNTGETFRSKHQLPHNKPDLLIWNRETKTCTVVEISCPADVNITTKMRDKLDKYGALLRNLQMLYTDSKFEMAPITIGAFWFYNVGFIHILKSEIL